jgi:hypothetical protein
MAAEVDAKLTETSYGKPFSYRRRLAYPGRARALGKPMNFKRAGFVALTMLSLWVATLFLFCVITALMKASQTLPDPWGTAFAFSCTAVYIALFVLLFFGLPELLLLLRLRALGLWTRVVVGGASSGFYLFALFTETWSATIVQKSKSVTEAMVWALKVKFGDPIGLVSVFFKHVDIGSLIFVVLLGMAFGAFLWAPIYRLRGDNRRDWDQPMLGGPPPYAR